MNQKKGKYEYLRDQYPSMVSLEQFAKICGIAKRSASYLITHGIVPAIDSGQRTWRYRIAIGDVMTYLRHREQVGSMIPVGAVTQVKKESHDNYLGYIDLVRSIGTEQLKQRFYEMLKDKPDVVNVAVASQTIGLTKKTIIAAIKKGTLKHITVGKDFLLPKVFLVEYMASTAYLSAKSSSKQHIRIIESITING